MNKKLIIQFIVIVGAFSAAGLVLYNGLFKGGSGTQPFAPTASQSKQSILPYGTSMDFNVLYPKGQNLQYNVIAFPVLNPSEVGIPEIKLITPVASTPVKK